MSQKTVIIKSQGKTIEDDIVNENNGTIAKLIAELRGSVTQDKHVAALDAKTPMRTKYVRRNMTLMLLVMHIVTLRSSYLKHKMISN